MTTIADLVRDVRSRISGTFSDELTTLSAPYAPGDTTISVEFPAQITSGSVLSCEENTWYVLAVADSDQKQFRVLPSYDGGPDLAKLAGAVVRVKPRVTDWSIFTHLRDQVGLMSSPKNGLGIVDFWMETGATTQSGQYPPPDGVTPSRIRGVYAYDGQRWWPLTGSQWAWTLGSVRIYDDRWAGYCVVYEAPFVTPTAFADTLEDIGMVEAMRDIPVLGASGMLMLTMESRRQQLGAQGDPRRANEVQAGSNMGAGREWLRMRDDRIGEEALRSINIEAIGGLSA